MRGDRNYRSVPIQHEQTRPILAVVRLLSRDAMHVDDTMAQGERIAPTEHSTHFGWLVGRKGEQRIHGGMVLFAIDTSGWFGGCRIEKESWRYSSECYQSTTPGNASDCMRAARGHPAR